MTGKIPLLHRRFAALACALAIAASATGCAASTTPAPPLTPSMPITEGQNAVMYPEIKSAIAAAEPRVTTSGITQSQSGAAQVMSVGVTISGDEPVTTASLTAMLIAIREALPGGIDQVSLIVRDDSSKSRIVDISTAVAGLPAGVTPLYDGALTLMRQDLDKL